MIQPGRKPGKRDPPVYSQTDHAPTPTRSTDISFGIPLCDSDCSCGSEEDCYDDDDYNTSDSDYDDEDGGLTSTHPQKIQTCFMMEDYDEDFPPLERQERGSSSSRPYIQPHAVEPSGQMKPLSQGEEVLNWQTRNARAQNKSQQSIDTRVSQILDGVSSTNDKIDTLKSQLQYVEEKLTNKIAILDRDQRTLISRGTEFHTKEAEIRDLRKDRT